MSDLNNYSFTGRLGANAETKFTQGGTAIWSARVAVGYGFGDNKGTNWITVKAFGKRAEGLDKLDLAKGSHIGGSGELQVREYDRKDGTKGTSIEVTVNDVALLGGKPTDKPARQESRGGGGQSPPQSRDEFEDDPDIPFASPFGIF
jgi:single-strand DNA-binding protein